MHSIKNFVIVQLEVEEYQGEPLGPGGQMYALTYSEYEGRDSPVDGLAKLLKSNKAVKQQMIYPKATQYACTLLVFRNDSSNACQQKVLCILDKVAPAKYEMEGTACNQNSDCTYIRPAGRLISTGFAEHPTL
ncbi:hypothetical protein RB195_004396 [Necator americanus]|uniref:Uncharacterized protein n=1 Tax=Necator americanus TaxID=51031 RepID=A0ABR1BL90_NECAM